MLTNLFVGGAPNYFPNSFNGPADDLKYRNCDCTVVSPFVAEFSPTLALDACVPFIVLNTSLIINPLMPHPFCVFVSL